MPATIEDMWKIKLYARENGSKRHGLAQCLALIAAAVRPPVRLVLTLRNPH